MYESTIKTDLNPRNSGANLVFLDGWNTTAGEKDLAFGFIDGKLR